jgi:hypothetical protein
VDRLLDIFRVLCAKCGKVNNMLTFLEIICREVRAVSLVLVQVWVWVLLFQDQYKSFKYDN